MKKEDFKFIVNKVEPKKNKATMRLFTEIHSWSAYEFQQELRWLEEQGIEEVDLLINSVGGSVIAGLSIYSGIQHSPIKFTTINVGVSMSMGSIIWASGDILRMHDYSLLMIHAPYSSENMNDADTIELVSKTRHQLKTIYTKRFGMSEEDVDAIIDGKPDIDGTYFTAEEAVTAGFIKSSDIIKTEQIESRKFLNNISDSIDNKAKYAQLLAKAVEKNENEIINIVQPEIETESIIDQKANKVKNQKNMDTEKFIFASLDMSSGDATQAVEKINAMKSQIASAMKEKEELQAKVSDFESKLKAQELVNKGNEASIKNLKETVEAQTKKIKVFEDAEKLEKETAINNMVEDAIKAGKITEETRAQWVELANSNLKLAETTLNGIEAKQPISQAIGANKDGFQKTVDAGKSVEALKSAEAETSDYMKSVEALISE